MTDTIAEIIEQAQESWVHRPILERDKAEAFNALYRDFMIMLGALRATYFLITLNEAEYLNAASTKLNPLFPPPPTVADNNE